MQGKLREMPRLHWSYDYNIGTQKPDFLREFLGILRQHQGGDSRTATYAILPNFWRGYHAHGDAELQIGLITLQRNQGDLGHWRYAVRVVNSTSGEAAEYQFTTRDDAMRSLVGTWSLSTSAAGSGSYGTLHCTGEITDDGNRNTVALHYDKLVLEDTVDSAIPVTCNWALFDVIPQLARQSDTTATIVTLVEDLTRLRRETHIQFLETWMQASGVEDEPPLELRGYVVHGTGLPPSYWWLNENDQIVIVSTIFQTWVLAPGDAQGDRS